MFQYLLLIPAGTSLILGIVYLFLGEGRALTKGIGVVVFLVALYLQFASPYAVPGLLLQTALALSLAVWKKMDGAT
jgi:hypothetical protein